MGKTTIEVSDDIADWLWAKKRRGESYNDVLERMKAAESGDEATPATADPSTLPEDLEVPGSGDRADRRREAIAQMHDRLRVLGTATKSELLEVVDPEHVGYQSRHSFWSNVVKGRDTLRALPDVESPSEGGTTWKWIG